MSSIDPAHWDRALTLVRGARSVLLLGHVAPDGDALGSALAFGLALTRQDPTKVVQVSFGDEPFVVPANLKSLPGLSLLVAPGEVAAAFDVVITFDASSADRLGHLRERAETAPHLIVVDHHASFDGFGDMHLVDTAAPATAVVVDEFIVKLGIELDVDIAACLYTGLVTDTGSFRYAGTTVATHEFAGRLLGTGIPFDEISRELFDDAPFGYLKLLGNALTRATWTVRPQGDSAWSGRWFRPASVWPTAWPSTSSNPSLMWFARRMRPKSPLSSRKTMKASCEFRCVRRVASMSAGSLPAWAVAGTSMRPGLPPARATPMR